MITDMHMSRDVSDHISRQGVNGYRSPYFVPLLQRKGYAGMQRLYSVGSTCIPTEKHRAMLVLKYFTWPHRQGLPDEDSTQMSGFKKREQFSDGDNVDGNNTH